MVRSVRIAPTETARAGSPARGSGSRPRRSPRRRRACRARLVDREGHGEVESAARPAARGRHLEVLGEDLPVGAAELVLERRLERVRRAGDMDRAGDRLARERRLDEDRRRLRPRSRRAYSALPSISTDLHGRELGERVDDLRQRVPRATSRPDCIARCRPLSISAARPSDSALRVVSARSFRSVLSWLVGFFASASARLSPRPGSSYGLGRRAILGRHGGSRRGSRRLRDGVVVVVVVAIVAGAASFPPQPATTRATANPAATSRALTALTG